MINKLCCLIKLFIGPAEPVRFAPPIKEPNYKLQILQQKVRSL